MSLRVKGKWKEEEARLLAKLPIWSTNKPKKMDRSTLNKVQHQFWVTKQTVFRKLGKKEDDCIVASDAMLDAKLELFKSIQLTSSAMNKILDRYQEKICFLAQEQNAMGRFLKEYGKTDKSGAGKMMIQMGKSLIYCSQQEIALRPPLLRLYQEVETFRNRAVEDTLETIKNMERVRTEYRASLNWMKNVSQELDPDTYKQMEKFRKVQTHVKRSKAQFDKLKLACLQKVDLLAAARCNMFSHALIQYQNAAIKITGKNAKIYNTLATTFKGYQHFEFSVVKELAEPSKKLAAESGPSEAAPVDLCLFDFGEENSSDQKSSENQPTTDPSKGSESTEKLIGIDDDTSVDATARRLNQRRQNEEDLLASANAAELLENLLGGVNESDQSPETESAQDALDLGLGLFSPTGSSSSGGGAGAEGSKDKEASSSANSRLSIGSLSLLGKSSSQKDKKKEEKEKDAMDFLLGEDFDSMALETNDTMALLNEILSTGPPQSFLGSSLLATPTSNQQQPLLPTKESSLDGTSNLGGASATNATAGAAANPPPGQPAPTSFLPSQLLDFGSLDSTGDLLNFNHHAPLLNASSRKKSSEDSGAGLSTTPGVNKSWYDIFADLDPIANPDAIGPPTKTSGEEQENRYC